MVKKVMKKLPKMEEMMDMYCGPDLVTAKQQQEELQRVANTLPANAPTSVKKFTDRVVLSLQVTFYLSGVPLPNYTWYQTNFNKGPLFLKYNPSSFDLLTKNTRHAIVWRIVQEKKMTHSLNSCKFYICFRQTGVPDLYPFACVTVCVSAQAFIMIFAGSMLLQIDFLWGPNLGLM